MTIKFHLLVETVGEVAVGTVLDLIVFTVCFFLTVCYTWQVTIIKQPVIRNGQHKPYVQATRDQIQQRIGTAAALSYCRFSKPRIRRVFRELFGVEARQAERYMTGANGEVSLFLG